MLLIELNLQMFLHVLQQIGSWLETEELLLDLLTIHEANQRWQCLHLQVLHHFCALVRIHLHNLNLTIVLLRDLVQDGCQGLAWTTPIGVHINEYGHLGTLNLLLKLLDIVDVDDTGGGETGGSVSEESHLLL